MKLAAPKKTKATRPTAKRVASKPSPAPIPADKRGRKGHAAVDEQPGLRDWLRERLMQTPRPTLDEIVEDLKGTGFSIGRTAIWKFKVAFLVEQEQLRLMLDLAKQYNEVAADGVLDIETAIGRFAAQRIFTELVSHAGDKTIDEETRELLKVFAKLQASSAQRERTKFAVERGIAGTAARLRAEMREALRKDPATLKKVVALIDSAVAAEVRS